MNNSSSAMKLQDFAMNFSKSFVANGSDNSPANTQITAKERKAIDSTTSGLRSDLPPAQLGYVPLLDSYVATIEDILQHFEMKYSITDFWLHLNTKLFGSLSTYVLNEVNPFSIMDFLQVCKDNNLNPLKAEVAGYFDWTSKSIKPQILLDGYCKIFNTHPQTDGMEYNCIGSQEVELTITEYVKENGQRRAKTRPYKTVLPRTVECRIYRKDRKFPTVGCADIEDIGTSAAWQQHPLQMLRNRAFTRAVRMAFNLEGASYSDVEEIVEHDNYALELRCAALEKREEDIKAKESVLKDSDPEVLTQFKQRISNATTKEALDAIKVKLMQAVGDKLSINDFNDLSLQINNKRKTCAAAGIMSLKTVPVRELPDLTLSSCDTADLSKF